MSAMQRELAPEIADLLNQRARALAKAPADTEQEDVFHAVVFSFEEHRYAIDARYVKEIQTLANLTPVPSTPDFVAGIVNLRGTLFSLIDLRRFMDLPVRGVTDLTQIIVVSGGGLDLGLLAYEVLGLVAIPSDDVKAPLPNDDNVAKEFVSGVTSDLTVILNIDKILSDPKLIVHEEVIK